MIYKSLNFLKTTLNNYLLKKLAIDSVTDGISIAPKVAFPDIASETPSFLLEAVTLMIVNIEEERLLRSPNPYTQLSLEGVQTKTYPPLSLELTLLFAAKFSDYGTALKYLSHTAQFFQSHPIFTSHQFPLLPAEIDKLTVEFLSLENIQKNEIWNSLRVSYLPSLVYNLKMLVYHEEVVNMGEEVIESGLKIN